MKYAANTDTSHKPILDGLREAGYFCIDVHRCELFVDILVAVDGHWMLLECKKEKWKKPRQDRPNELRQHERMLEWATHGPCHYVRTLAEALRIVGHFDRAELWT